MRARLALGGVGVVAGLYGLWLLLSRQDLDQLRSAAYWLVAGVVLHDAVLAPVVVVLVLLGARLLPEPARAPAAVALVVLGSLTLWAVPVLGRFGARPDNPTLLNRDYFSSWVVLVAVTVLAVAGAGWLRRRRTAPPDEGEDNA